MRQSTTLSALLCFLLVICQGVTSRAQQYRFENLTVESGLSQSQVLTIHQSPSGEMWIGTASGGITIFDGLNASYLSRKDGLPSNTIYDIKTLKDGTTAVATFEGFSLISDSIRNFGLADGLPDDLVYCIHQDPNGRVFLGTGKGVVEMVGDGSFVETDAKLNGLPVFQISDGPGGLTWFSTLGHGVFRKAGGTFKQYDLDDGLKSLNVNGVFHAGDSTYVFTYEGVSLITSDGSLKDPTSFPLKDELVFDAWKDDHGGVWFGTKKGLFHQNDETHYYRKEDGLVGNMVCCLVQDSEGHLWAGSRENGVSKLSLRVFETIDHSRGFPNNSINRMMTTPDGEVWVATEAGVVVRKPEGTWEQVGRYYALHQKEVRCMLPAGDAGTYLGTNNSLHLYTPGGYLKRIFTPAGSSYFFQDLFEYRDTVLAACNNGILMVKGSRLVRWELPGIPDGIVNHLLKDDLGRLWIATNEEGLWRVENGQAIRFGDAEGFSGKTVKSLFKDSKGRMWCSTNSGLFVFIDGHFHKYTSDDGFNSSSFVSVIQTNDSTFWTGLNRGAARFVMRGEELVNVENYGVEDGFSGQESNPRSVMVDRDGRVWFGTNGGINIFYPERESKNNRPPVTRIVDVRMFMQETNWSEYGVEAFEGNLPLGLELDYDKNNISFWFKGVSFSNPDQIRYRYQLIGEDQDWLETSERKADYSNLAPGSYTFEVIACNSDGVWNEEPSRFSFVIAPPFWQTWWFYAGCALLVAAAIYSYFKIRTANKKITQFNEILVEQRDIISQKNKDIMDSIHYAKRIQDAVLPPPDDIDLPKTFVFYRPKDVVSGDFYWFYNKPGLSFFAVADCTGHGVPGAFMSIIGHNKLDKIVGEMDIHEPAAILDRLNEEIRVTLNRRAEEGPVRDGLDISICCFHRDTEILEFAGAFHPLLLWRAGDLQIFKGDRKPIGSFHSGQGYTNHRIQLLKGDMIYLYTDGFVDQFGGEEGKKYKSVRFRKFVERIGRLEVNDQRNAFIREFESWKGVHEQIDDVLVLGTQL